MATGGATGGAAERFRGDPRRTSPNANGPQDPIGWRFDPARLHHASTGAPRSDVGFSAFSGPAYDGARVERALAREAAGLRIERPDDVVAATVRLLVDGGVIAWFQGRMEYGPRALGHRSILASPLHREMRDRINERIKHREEFRPFAGAVPLERAADWFELDGASPFMQFVVPVRAEATDRIPAVTHHGTCRAQTVDAADDRLFHRLLIELGRRTSVPVLLNTSFNAADEPIVCTPEDAIRSFRRMNRGLRQVHSDAERQGQDDEPRHQDEASPEKSALPPLQLIPALGEVPESDVRRALHQVHEAGHQQRRGDRYDELEGGRESGGPGESIHRDQRESGERCGPQELADRDVPRVRLDPTGREGGVVPVRLGPAQGAVELPTNGCPDRCGNGQADDSFVIPPSRIGGIRRNSIPGQGCSRASGGSATSSRRWICPRSPCSVRTGDGARFSCRGPSPSRPRAVP
jgi:hypothetical protein